jgi:deoxyribodipyrimidine photolyase-related protein
MKTLRIILIDQLNEQISSLRDLNPKQDTILMCEVTEECTYVKHHQKKLVFMLSAMRHFAKQLLAQGNKLIYIKLDDELNSGSIIGEIERMVRSHGFKKLIVTSPSEYRLLQYFQKLSQSKTIAVEIREDDRFLATTQEFNAWAKNRKELRMEIFYRQMRTKYKILMSGTLPEGGQWNFDAENRKFPKEKLRIPACYRAKTDKITQEVMALVAEKFADHFGEINPFYYAVTRKEALKALDLFIAERLPFFGDYQDAMIQNEPWMYHSHLSFYLNNGLLLPLECIKRAELAYYEGKVSINAAEGFIRQILGWREYIRGVYWLRMPEYKKLNFLSASRSLPEFYWTANTKMNCLKNCIQETKENAYAHHIQRLMVLGNFALLAGIHPDDVNEWYLIVYADAYEWVEMPNVTGMILFADGGYLASKPYAASGAYINKMSNYCKGCHYNVNEKNGPDACPFNYLYWDFLIRHRDKLKGNPRLTMVYSLLDKMSREKLKSVKADTKAFFKELEIQSSTYKKD